MCATVINAGIEIASYGHTYTQAKHVHMCVNACVTCAEKQRWHGMLSLSSLCAHLIMTDRFVKRDLEHFVDDLLRPATTSEYFSSGGGGGGGSSSSLW